MAENSVEKNRVTPDYYDKYGFSCWKMIEVITMDYPPDMGFYVGNVIKYLYRAPNKGGKQDLRKALTYLERVTEKM